MRVKYIIPPKLRPDFINQEMYTNLRHDMENHDEVDIVDLSPDIVHIFGIWSSSYARRVERYRSIDIPVIFTSINEILDIVSSSGHITSSLDAVMAIRKIASLNASIHVCGKTEENIIRKYAKKAVIKTVMNTTFTSLISRDEVSAEFYKIYVSETANNEKKIREMISTRIGSIGVNDKCILDICSRILYIKQRYHMQNIPLDYLKETAKAMTESNYDENVMRQTLAKMKLLDFASFTMTLLRNKANLTEGFMPIKNSEGKTVDKMEKVIIQ